MADESAGDAVQLSGFIISDKSRSTVFEAVVHGERDLAAITKRHRLIGPAATRAANELRERGVFAGEDGALDLTEFGREVADALERNRKKLL